MHSINSMQCKKKKKPVKKINNNNDKIINSFKKSVRLKSKEIKQFGGGNEWNVGRVSAMLWQVSGVSARSCPGCRRLFSRTTVLNMNAEPCCLARASQGPDWLPRLHASCRGSSKKTFKCHFEIPTATSRAGDKRALAHREEGSNVHSGAKAPNQPHPPTPTHTHDSRNNGLLCFMFHVSTVGKV